jgi:dTDP-4-dehydrorhamnose reductase
LTPVLVLGAGGMLGHKLWQHLQERGETWATVRSRAGLPEELFGGQRVIEGVDAFAFETIGRAIARSRPAVVVNCIGVVKQLKAAKDPVTSITINALLPHRLNAACRAAGARLVHISTDCVFSGDRGRYRETDRPDADDLYGRSKLLGEATTDGALTLRTSMIGRELRTQSGLVEWFLSQRGRQVQGFTRAIFSGLTTQVLAALIGDLIDRPTPLEGLFHVAAEPISKYDLLGRLNRAFGAGAVVEPTDVLRIDRSLDGGAFAAASGWIAPPWDEMIDRLAADETPYEDWRQRVS